MLEEKIILAKNSEYPLNGILTLPDDLSHKVPAVVFVHGSGTSNMDERVGKLTPFKDLARGLAQRGIASIRYDKRSFAHGLKMIRDKKHVVTVKEETIDDAIIATELLRKDVRIDSERIYIIGHSMGAMLAPRIDAEGGNYKGLIMMAGSPLKLEDIMLRQMREMINESNKFMTWIMNKQYQKYADLFAKIDSISDDEAKKIKMGNGITLYYFKEMSDHISTLYLEQIDKPMLIMQGAMDCQVSLKEDYMVYEEILANHRNVTFKLYSTLNHAFVEAISGDITKVKQEYNVERHIGDSVIDDIAGWINSN